MSKLTYEEFMLLSPEEKRVRVYELSPHDLFLVRISEPIIPRWEGETDEDWLKRQNEFYEVYYESARKERERREKKKEKQDE